MRKVMLLCAAHCAWLLSGASAADQPRTTPTAPPEYLARTNPVATSDQVLAEATAIYQRECRKCHGPDGRGHGSAIRGMKIKPPDFTDVDVMNTRPDGQLVWIILYGSDPDTTEMSGFKKKFSENDAWKLVRFIREFGRRAETATEAKVRVINESVKRGDDHEAH